MSERPFKKSVNDVVTFFPNVLIDEIMPICGGEEWMVISALVYLSSATFDRLKTATGMNDYELRKGIDDAMKRGIAKYTPGLPNHICLNYDFEIVVTQEGGDEH